MGHKHIKLSSFNNSHNPSWWADAKQRVGVLSRRVFLLCEDSQRLPSTTDLENTGINLEGCMSRGNIHIVVRSAKPLSSLWRAAVLLLSSDSSRPSFKHFGVVLDWKNRWIRKGHICRSHSWQQRSDLLEFYNY